MQVAV